MGTIVSAISPFSPGSLRARSGLPSGNICGFISDFGAAGSLSEARRNWRAGGNPVGNRGRIALAKQIPDQPRCPINGHWPVALSRNGASGNFWSNRTQTKLFSSLHLCVFAAWRLCVTTEAPMNENEISKIIARVVNGLAEDFRIPDFWI